MIVTGFPSIAAPPRAGHQCLREATAESHARLDALFSGFDLGDTRTYGTFLQAHAAAALPVESALDDAGLQALLPDWTERRRAAALRADLAALQMALPLPLRAPVLASHSALWGAAYVLEGSRLGGAVLARQLPPMAPQRYLAAASQAGHWPRFLKRLDAALDTGGKQQRAVDAALQVFALFEAAGRCHLSRNCIDTLTP